MWSLPRPAYDLETMRAVAVAYRLERQTGGLNGLARGVRTIEAQCRTCRDPSGDKDARWRGRPARMHQSRCWVLDAVTTGVTGITDFMVNGPYKASPTENRWDGPGGPCGTTSSLSARIRTIRSNLTRSRSRPR